MQAFTDYISSLKGYSPQNDTEHTYRSQLETLLNQLKPDPKIRVIHEPKRQVEYGAPDFKVIRDDMIIGYVENKAIGVNLDDVLKSDQIDRYKKLTSNLLLTNYLEWIWIRDGKIADRKTLCFPTDLSNNRFRLEEQNISAIHSLISHVLSTAPQAIAKPKALADALAKRARLLKEYLLDELKRQEKEQQEGRLFGLYETFKKMVDHELELESFTDTFAQMLVYGLFMSRLNSDTESIDLYSVKKYIPQSFELIRELVGFLDVLNEEDYAATRWVVEEVLNILNSMDISAIKEELSFDPSLRKKRKYKDSPEVVNTEQEIYTKDPYIYFYEDFLAAYDKVLKKAKGVYYTPLPVVNFIVRAINDVLIDTFQIPDGLANHKEVTVLDFACGTGTFLLEIVRHILENTPESKEKLLVKEHILKNIYGFEYMMAPYTVAHLKLSQYLKDNGFEMQTSEHMKIFLTNTLEHIDVQKDHLLPALSNESKAALSVKNKPILVITGNPPYNYVSKNNGKFIKGLIKEYYTFDGKPLGERNPKGLQDDYVKFMRFAQWKMEKEERGIVAIITNHAFLDNPTFRGMRQSLMKTFNQMYVIDLHGNSKKKEKDPNGDKEENVFDIEQGVCISILVRDKATQSFVKYYDLYGNRFSKYSFLYTKSISGLSFHQIHEFTDHLAFNLDVKSIRNYIDYVPITKIFSSYNTGIITQRNSLVIGFTPSEVEDKIQSILDVDIPVDDMKTKFGFTDKEISKLKPFRKRISGHQFDKKRINTIICRPFDTKYVYYDEVFVDRSRRRFYESVSLEDLSLISVRQVAEGVFNHVFITDRIIECRTMLSNKGYGYTFPFHVYEEIDFLGTTTKEVKNNISSAILKKLKDACRADVPAEKLFYYIYSILHSPTYRKKYAFFLKTDFPRIPFIENYHTFTQLADIGADLIQTHLQRKPDIKQQYAGLGDYAVSGSNAVEKISYKDSLKRLYINNVQYFTDIPVEVWELHIGGYQVLHKYLKDRTGRTLTLDEIENVEYVAKILQYTIDTMQKIDELTCDWI